MSGSIIQKPAGVNGTFSYRMSSIPDAAPEMTFYSDAARTISVAGPQTLVATANPLVFMASYFDSLLAGTYYLGLTFNLSGTSCTDQDDVLVLIAASGSIIGGGGPYGPCSSWTLDEDCCVFPEGATQEMIDKWSMVSTQLLWAASGRIYGACSVTVRPCLRSCGDSSRLWAPYLGRDGAWRNSYGCGCSGDCSCTELCEVILEGPVAEVSEVMINGELISTWRLHRIGEQARLIRTDGLCWPDCQDMSVDCGEEGSFCVTYMKGIPLSQSAIMAHTELTCELVKSCIPGCDCRLPRNVQSKTRQGISITFDTEQTWIRSLPMVAVWIDQVNPNGLPRPMRVISPDARGERRV